MRKPKFKYTKLAICGRVPERPLTENERLASAMGFIKVGFAQAVPRVRWCDLSKRLTQPEHARVWSAMCKESDDLQKEFPGSLFWPEEFKQDEPFVTGQVL